MLAKLLKLLSGIVAMAGRKSDTPEEFEALKAYSPLHNLFALEEKYHRLRDTNKSLVQEQQNLRNQLRQAESRADGMLGNEYAAELDRAKAFLQDAHGFSVSRMQVASAVENLSGLLDAIGSAAQKAECGTCRDSGVGTCGTRCHCMT